MIRYFKKSFVRYLAYGLAIALLSFLFGLFNAKALTCTGQGANGATYVDYSIVPTVGENIGGFIWYRSNSDNGYLTIVCQTNVQVPEEDDIYQNLIVSGTSFKIKSVAAFSGFGYFSDVLAYPSDVFGDIVGNYNIGFGVGNSTFTNQEYTGFAYGFSRVSTDQKVAFRVFVNNTNGERKTISFFSYTNSVEFIVGGGANSFEAMLAAFQQSQSNYNTDVINGSINDVNQSINDLNDNINNDNVIDAENKATEFFNNFTTNTHGLTGIITAPLNAISSITSSTCTPLVLPLPFVDEDLTLPCMRPIYEHFFGDFMTLYDIVVLGIVSYWIVVRIFSLVKDFKNPEHDEVEVMEL